MSETNVAKAEIRISVRESENAKFYCVLEYFINDVPQIIDHARGGKNIIFGPFDTKEQADKCHAHVSQDVESLLSQVKEAKIIQKGWVEDGRLVGERPLH